MLYWEIVKISYLFFSFNISFFSLVKYVWSLNILGFIISSSLNLPFLSIINEDIYSLKPHKEYLRLEIKLPISFIEEFKNIF